jgi:hypothetical protein
VSTAVAVTGSGADKWQLSFALPDGQKLLRGWSPGWAQEGQAIQVTGTGLPVTTGFDSSYRSATTLPAQFRLNGTVCEAEMSVAGRSAPPATTVAAVKPTTKRPAAKTSAKHAAKPPAPKPKQKAGPKPKAAAKSKGKP